MSLKWMIVFTVLGLAIARPDSERSSQYQSGGSEAHGEEHGYGSSRSYEFKYDIDEQDSSEEDLKFGHYEKKSDDRVEGNYYVLLPDGRLQKVEYYVDGDSGFVAKVSYEGSAEFPTEEGSSYGKQS